MGVCSRSNFINGTYSGHGSAELVSVKKVFRALYMPFCLVSDNYMTQAGNEPVALLTRDVFCSSIP